jgi:hypothetical protein
LANQREDGKAWNIGQLLGQDQELRIEVLDHGHSLGPVFRVEVVKKAYFLQKPGEFVQLDDVGVR